MQEEFVTKITDIIDTDGLTDKQIDWWLISAYPPPPPHQKNDTHLALID